MQVIQIILGSLLTCKVRVFNMKKLLILTLFSSLVLAQSTIESCRENAGRYLQQKGSNPLHHYPADCYPLIWQNKNNVNYDESSDNYVQVMGDKNIVLTKIYGPDAEGNPLLLTEHIIAGDLTNLHDIQAVDFHEADGRFYVLNKDSESHQQVYSYVYNNVGNAAPARKLINTEADSASNIRVDSSNIYLISKLNNWVKAFNREADPNSKNAAHSTATLRTIEGVNTTINAPVDIVLSATEIFILEGSRVLVFNKSDSGDVAPKRVLEGNPTAISGAKKIEIEGSEIHITNGDNSIIKLPL